VRINQEQTLADRNRSIVGVQIAYEESELRQRLKAAGGHWSRSAKLWFARYDTVISLGLKKRIIANAERQCKDLDLELLFI
jgi:hypothetical protein